MIDLTHTSDAELERMATGSVRVGEVRDATAEERVAAQRELSRRGREYLAMIGRRWWREMAAQDAAR